MKQVPVIAALLALLPGCSYIELPLYDSVKVFQAHPSLKEAVVEAPRYEPSEKEEEEATDWVEADSRLIKGGDALRIRVAGQEDLSRDQQVRPDGSIDFPTLDSVVVSGRTVGEAEEKIARALSKKLRNPKVTILVAREDRRSVDVVGMVNRQKNVTFRFAPWLSGVLTQTGGYSRLANLTQVLVVRPSEKKVIVSDVYSLNARDDAKQNVRMRDGDVVVVTRRYPGETVACAREWKPVAEFIEGGITRDQLVEKIKTLPPPSWKEE